ncbi:hypothetical protein PPYR_08267 [Photinus pyralis]|uniref:CRAL-TRIO domain-containing protein n=1 Tax=Photinus pyralis TaxID=7054 RepID=A0A5N4AIZ9_PHOPY|nr:hypothetical protein PPYR_08267 [Photinus pyralis]
MVYRELSNELQRKAEEELNENPSRVQEDLEYIREWIKKQPHLISRTDDQFLLSFLRGCKFSLHRTQVKLDYYYTVKTIATEFFTRRDPFDQDIQEVLRLGVILPLPKTETPDGPRILLLRSSLLNLDKINYLAYYKLLFMMFDILLMEDDNFTVSGIIAWSIGKNLTIRHTMHLTPSLLKKLNDISLKGYPIRMRSLYCTQCPQLAETFFNLSKSFAPEKLSKRMFLYSESHHEEFCKKFPIQFQPEDYGGQNGSLSGLTEYWKTKVEGYCKWFLEDKEYGTKEDLRLGAPNTSASLFGIKRDPPRTFLQTIYNSSPGDYSIGNMVYRELSNELQKKAEEELHENSSRVPEDLEYIREWIKMQPHLTSRTDDQFLLSFLRGCKFSLHRTQEKLDYYYTVKTIATEFFTRRDPFDQEIQEVLRLGVILPLPKTETPDGPRILLVRSPLLNFEKINYLAFHKVLFMMYDILLMEDDNFTVSGVIAWFFGKNLTIRHTMHLTPALLKKLINISLKGYPIRMKSLYSTHCPQLVETIINLSKSFAPEKLSKRMFLYSESSHEEFCKKIPIQLQPEDYGGENGSLTDLAEYWKSNVESYSKWFLEDEEYGTKEDLRFGTPNTSASLFGMEGTFRKLNLD